MRLEQISVIGEGTPVEGDYELGDSTLDYFPQRGGKDVKEANVRENGNDEDVNIEDTVGKREALDETSGRFDAGEGSGEGSFPNFIQRDGTSNDNAKVRASITEGEVGGDCARPNLIALSLEG